MNNNAAIDATFAKEWLIDGVTVLARYRFKDEEHRLKTRGGVLGKDVVCVSPKAERFVVVDSKRVSTNIYQHILQVEVANKATKDDWKVSR